MLQINEMFDKDGVRLNPQFSFGASLAGEILDNAWTQVKGCIIFF
jgi:hypothetical protein